MTKKYQLPDLPYDFSALEPVISAEIMQLHHNKHHAAYVNNLNIALEQSVEAEEKGDLARFVALQSAVKFNGGGHINHSIFWETLAPEGEGGRPEGILLGMIESRYGSLELMIDELSKKAVAIQGSGWAWLGLHAEKKTLCTLTCANQDPLSTLGYTPLFGIDVWEHAYYLQYKNVRAEYVKNIWRLVNWKNVRSRLEGAL